MTHKTSIELIGLDYAMVGNSVCVTTEPDDRPVSSAYHTHARATRVTEYALDEHDLVLKFHYTTDEHTNYSLEMFPETFDFLTHLANGAELRVVRNGQPDTLVDGVIDVLTAWHRDLRQDGVKAAPTGNLFERPMWFLEQSHSPVYRYDSESDLLYLAISPDHRRRVI